MVNKSISKLLGTPRSDGQFAKKSTATSRPASAKIFVDNGRKGYGVNGVDVGSGGSHKGGRSQIGLSRRNPGHKNIR